MNLDLLYFGAALDDSEVVIFADRSDEAYILNSKQALFSRVIAFPDAIKVGKATIVVKNE